MPQDDCVWMTDVKNPIIYSKDNVPAYVMPWLAIIQERKKEKSLFLFITS